MFPSLVRATTPTMHWYSTRRSHLAWADPILPLDPITGKYWGEIIDGYTKGALLLLLDRTYATFIKLQVEYTLDQCHVQARPRSRILRLLPNQQDARHPRGRPGSRSPIAQPCLPPFYTEKPDTLYGTHPSLPAPHSACLPPAWWPGLPRPPTSPSQSNATSRQPRWSP